MKSAVETLSPTRAKLIIEVPFEELKGDLDAAYKTIGGQIQVPGFRRGKVPNRIIDQRFGRGAVVQEAVNEALPRLYAEAVDKEGLKAIGQPEVDITGVPLAEGEPLEFTVETDVRPSVVIPDLSGLEIEVDPAEVTAEDIEEQLTELRGRFGTLVTVERSAQEGDVVTVDLAASIGDDEIDAIEGAPYEVGSDTMLEGMDEAVTGLTAGESTTFASVLAGGDHKGELADCTVTVTAVKVRELPELDDDFAQLASPFDTVEELRADVATQVQRRKKLEQGMQARDKMMDHLMDTLDVPVPDGIVESEVHAHLESEDRLEDEEHRAEIDESTRRALKAQFILDAIVELREVEVEQGELIEYLVMSAQQYGMDPNAFAQAIDGQGQIPAMVSEVARRKALALVLEDAVVKDSNGVVVDLAELADEDDFEEEDEDDVEDEGDVVDAVVETVEVVESVEVVEGDAGR